jgi:hypothetical protein
MAHWKAALAKISAILLLVLVQVVAPTSAISEGAGAKKGDSDLKTFLLSTEGTYGWNPVEGTISYDFFPDGRLHIQGPDGEATMWQGRWTLKGDKLTLLNDDQHTIENVTAAIDGKDLLLNGKRYKRYSPEQ